MGVLEELRELGERNESALCQILALLKVSENPVWRTIPEARDMFRLERRMFNDLLRHGVAAGKVKTMTFLPASKRPQTRVDVTSFERYLRDGGITE